jgi:citrate lyase beta subunit
MIETAKGVINVESIANSDHVKALVFGMNDLTKDLGARFVPNRTPLLYSMSKCIVAARAYDKMIIDGVFMDINDNKGLLEDCIRGRELGFDGKSLIHPDQIETSNSVFSPSIEEINDSKRIIESYNDAISQGKSLAVLDGKLIEYLHVIIAQDIINKSNIITKLS